MIIYVSENIKDNAIKVFGFDHVMVMDGWVDGKWEMRIEVDEDRLKVSQVDVSCDI